MKISQRKNIIYFFILFILIIFIFFYEKDTSHLISIQGITMGVIKYRVKYINNNKISYQENVDSLLEKINNSLSTYISDSEISRFNNGKLTRFKSLFFYEVLTRSKEIYQKTHGAFDPTVFPLVQAWNFGPSKNELPSQEKINSLLDLIDFESIHFTDSTIESSKIGISLDFSAIAKGYAVDKVAELLHQKNVNNYMVEIGGEVRCSGKNLKNNFWKIGIRDPQYKEKKQSKPTVIILYNKSLATSGNYENYYIKGTKKYSHTINPYTGYPVTHNLLSASVLAKDCMTADAYATALMVMGEKKSIDFLKKQQEIEGFLIFSENGKLTTYQTESFREKNR